MCEESLAKSFQLACGASVVLLKHTGHDIPVLNADQFWWGLPPPVNPKNVSPSETL